ncbi:malto-oligosyltrehalose trehalohydrolase [Pontibacter qinzhouensis]|uniref:Malto-oligosyltrehalose trehalohydrolase n=1 Tax=Pontibacter qinzhouensis TaxID=2603253 RepID=A0A5C8IK74_9BACT|nr:malto-oligosyltrehalose trehalohydrolase [Pontibacter qinzhouensis]TXK21567.1 malto-oligosyltrehalose trehalohydrolase [Pontibacter qinzhouensis]
MGITRAIGAAYTAEKGTTFTVWAPDAQQVEVIISAPETTSLTLQKEAFGYWTGSSDKVLPGARYKYRLNNETERPDPASQFQPDTVHAASEVIDHGKFTWTDENWKGIPLEKFIIYELHVGTFSEEGTFEGIIKKLPELQELGITAIELMPLAQFPGERNWGYDGVYPFAVQNSYGGPEGLKNLVNACHEKGIAVILDVVYNHMGPEGNYLNDYGPYFTKKYNTPWGAALNFDDAHSDHVRNFFLQNALMWLRDFHIDALRLDAVHAILDMGSKHFLQELQEHVSQLGEQLGREFTLIAESDLNDVRLLNPIDKGGYGLAGQWMDDFHHAVHTLVTGEREGYYEDYGDPDQLVKTLQHGFIYNGIYSEHRKKTLGTDASGNPAKQFVVCIQNHDQVGNRMLGERISQLVSFEKLKLVAGLVLLSPYTPMLFMGEEYGEDNPFLYFVSHTDENLVELVRKGRKEEFSAFSWKGEAPDPQALDTFQKSKLQHSYHQQEQQKQLREYYKELIKIRKAAAVFAQPDHSKLQAHFDKATQVLQFTHLSPTPHLHCLVNFSDQPQHVTVPQQAGSEWNILLNSSDQQWGGNAAGSEATESETNSFLLQPESLLTLQSKK